MQAKLVTITENAEETIAYCARVSNPLNQNNNNISKLLKYCIKNNHWSIFEMGNMVIEVKGPRDILRQILRHRSFTFQEFSQRYAAVETEPFIREARSQDEKNRQNSNILPKDDERNDWFIQAQHNIYNQSNRLYKEALEKGIAKEQARCLLPEGTTMSTMYINGTIRSWIHYIQLRKGNGTQKEHQEIVEQIYKIFEKACPTIASCI